MSVEKDDEKKRLIAEIKAQYPNMSEEILKALSQYSVDNLKDVRQTLKADRDKFEFVVRGYGVTMSGGDGKPLNIRVVAPDGSLVQSSLGSERSSVASLGEDGQIRSVTQVNNKTQEMSYRDGDGTQVYAQKNGNKTYLEVNNNDENGDLSLKSKVTDSGKVDITFHSNDDDSEIFSKIKKNGDKISAKGTISDKGSGEKSETDFKMNGDIATLIERNSTLGGKYQETEAFFTDGSNLYTREYSSDEENHVIAPEGIINRDKGSTYVEPKNPPQGEIVSEITLPGGSFLKTDKRDGGVVSVTKEKRTIPVLDIIKKNKGYGK